MSKNRPTPAATSLPGAPGPKEAYVPPAVQFIKITASEAIMATCKTGPSSCANLEGPLVGFGS